MNKNVQVAIDAEWIPYSMSLRAAQAAKQSPNSDLTNVFDQWKGRFLGE
jgi:hypothetical protein